MKKIIAALAFLLFLYTAAYAQAPKPSVDPYHDWMTYYYVYNDSAKVPGFLKWLEDSGTLEKFPRGAASVEGFLSIVFAGNPAKVDGWLHGYNFTGKTKEALDYSAKPTVAPEAKAIKNTDDLEMIWGSFYASGKDLYLSKIVDVLDKNTALEGDAKKDEATRAAAATSLGSNMTQHEAVDRFLSAESMKHQGELGTQLGHIVGEVRTQREARSFPHQDGDFSAVMFVTDPKVAEKEFAAASSDNILHFKEIKKAKAGDVRTVVIVFAGQQLTHDYLADVTYDVQLRNPAGKLYSEQKDLEGIKQKLPTRWRVFNNKAAVFISFDKKDQPGVYKVNVTLKDNIGRKSVPLEAKIIFRK